MLAIHARDARDQSVSATPTPLPSRRRSSSGSTASPYLRPGCWRGGPDQRATHQARHAGCPGHCGGGELQRRELPRAYACRCRAWRAGLPRWPRAHSSMLCLPPCRPLHTARAAYGSLTLWCAASARTRTNRDRQPADALPVPQGDTPPDLVNRWGKDTFDHYLDLYQSSAAPEAGALRSLTRSTSHAVLSPSGCASRPKSSSACLPEAVVPPPPCPFSCQSLCSPAAAVCTYASCAVQAPSSPRLTSCSEHRCPTQSGPRWCRTFAI